jgi:hypothetical protein
MTATLFGASSMDFSGRSVFGAGDMKGDGIEDLIVGAWGGDVGGSNSGAVHMVYGVSGARGATFDLADLNGPTAS